MSLRMWALHAASAREIYEDVHIDKFSGQVCTTAL
jgi:hypothetical protein